MPDYILCAATQLSYISVGQSSFMGGPTPRTYGISWCDIHQIGAKIDDQAIDQRVIGSAPGLTLAQEAPKSSFGENRSGLAMGQPT